MSIVIDLPPRLEEELSIEAVRDGITPSDRAAFLLCLASALIGERPETPFRGAVRSFLDRHRIDPVQISTAFDQLGQLCLEANPHLDPSTPPDIGPRDSIDPSDRHGLDFSLRDWRNALAHQPIPEGLKPSTQTPRVIQPSIRGKYAFIGFTSEDHAREKQEEIAREDRY